MKDFTELPDLASERFGGRALEANDEFFGSKENLLKDSKPVFIEGRYTNRGKWMDGWETRRRRAPGYDWCVIRLGLPGILRGVVVDTSFFRGNYPEQFSLEACALGGSPPYMAEKNRLKAADTPWIEVLPQTPLRGDTLNRFPVDHPGRFTHLRLKIYPDGGIARLRVHGEAVPDEERIRRKEIDLAAIENGGRVVASSDQFFSEPLHLLMPGRAKNMSDGWETRRRRGPGHDWVILRLGVPGTIRRVDVDTSFFKGNFPESCSLEGCRVEGAMAEDPPANSAVWKRILERIPLRANRRHFFRENIQEIGPVTHVRFNIFPDGGVSRLRLYGSPESSKPHSTGIQWFNELSSVRAAQALLDCCGSKKWVHRVLAERPFKTVGHLSEVAEKAWASLDRADWLEAFFHHPPIGGTRAKAKQSPKATRWSKGEQSSVNKASSETRAALASANRAYREKFGFVFLICAAGKSGEEVLEELQRRLSSDPEGEIRIAAEEQRKITRLRLQKLLET